MSAQILPTYGQSAPMVQGGGGNGNLAGTIYNGQFTNSVSNIPLVGGAIGSGLDAMYGTKYSVPDPTATAGSAVSGNLANLGNIYNLTQGADTAAAAGAAIPYQMNLPNYEANLTQASTNVGSELSGQLPPDVMRLLQTNAAERGVAGGFGANNPNTSASYLQALGLTSLGEQQQGLQGLEQLISGTPTGPQFNPSSMFVTPEQQEQAQLLANEEAAAPDPELAGLANTFTSLFNLGGATSAANNMNFSGGVTNNMNADGTMDIGLDYSSMF